MGQFKSRGRRLALGVAVALLVPAAVALAVTGTYNGKTKQGRAVHIVIKSNVVQISSGINWKAKCKRGGSLTDGTRFKGRLTSGKYYVHGTYSGKVPVTGGGTVKTTNTVTISFKVSGSSAAGYIAVHAVVSNGDVCNTGVVRFTAKS